jgi:nicotinate-nucleotide adenylyltransferase
MSQLALFGTSADPPTCGHQALLEGLLALYPAVATWASTNPLKQHGAPLEERAQLLGCLVEAIDNPRLEHAQELSSPWTIETLERAHQRWPDAELVFVVGSDLAAQIPSWKQADQLLSGCSLAIVPRLGWPLTGDQLEALEKLGSKPLQLDLQIPATASSAVRERLDPSQIPATVLPALLKHNRYGLAEPPC